MTDDKQALILPMLARNESFCFCAGDSARGNGAGTDSRIVPVSVGMMDPLLQVVTGRVAANYCVKLASVIEDD